MVDKQEKGAWHKGKVIQSNALAAKMCNDAKISQKPNEKEILKEIIKATINPTNSERSIKEQAKNFIITKQNRVILS